ncbi:hypothetical protein J2T12_004173 [Paenibacillus anaericanus]|uniref:glycoside hydrolase family 28 protein n=1 Tax=Paenibacillus anaericanus TaxID=170367 RepID=UPI00278972D4|nr:glycosyl hydrolase family 28 protein [Paenibacillus anaericanus]MDQ0090750.1 hypothetical protein [Paenibacillus anaericanus]
MNDQNLYEVNSVNIRIYPAPPEIGYAMSEERLTEQGNDAFGADPDGVVLSRDWSLRVGGYDIPVYSAPVTSGGPLSFASFDYADEMGEITLVARSTQPIDSVTLRPLSLVLQPEVMEQEVRIKVSEPTSFIVEANGDLERPLFITVHAPESDVPADGDANVIYYGPGLHEVSTLELTKDQTLYIAGGAVLRIRVPEDEVPIDESDWAKQKVYRDTIVAYGTENITIRGRGIIDLSMLDWHARKAILIHNCKRVLIDGLTCVGTSHWTIHLLKSSDCVIRDITLIGHRENSDGIDIVNSENVLVDHCFIRTGDDAVVVKAMEAPPAMGGRNIVVRNCIVWNDKVRCFGITGETRTGISNVVFENCDIVHSLAVWTEELGSLCIIVGDSGTIENIRFDNIRIEDERRYAMACLIFKDRWSVDAEAGRIKDIVFRNIHVPAGVPSLFHGFDAEHRVENIVIEGLFAGGQPIEDIEQANFNMNEYVNHIRLTTL